MNPVQIVYILIIADEEQQSTTIHSVYSEEKIALKKVKELESNLSNLIVYVEEHEVL